MSELTIFVNPNIKFILFFDNGGCGRTCTCEARRRLFYRQADLLLSHTPFFAIYFNINEFFFPSLKYLYFTINFHKKKKDLLSPFKKRGGGKTEALPFSVFFSEPRLQLLQ